MTHLVTLAALGEGRHYLEWYDYFFLAGAIWTVLGGYGLLCASRFLPICLDRVRGSLAMVVTGVGSLLVFYGWFVLGSLLIVIGMIDLLVHFRQQRI